MIRIGCLCIVVALALQTLIGCNKASVFDASGYDDRLSGGAATVFDETSEAFGKKIPNLGSRGNKVHDIGDQFFEASFVSARGDIYPGLGPVFNNVSCIACHRKDGKGVPIAGTVNAGLLFRISVLNDENLGPVPIPDFGGQLQDLAVFGKAPEAKVQITYTDQVVVYPDGQQAMLRKPTYTLINPYIPLPASVKLSPRLAPPVFGVGLLENIPDATILSFADENDRDGDGISGRPNYLTNPYNGKRELGRFGLKAGTSNLLWQSAAAFQQDMGITSYIFPKESSYGQIQYDGIEDDPEIEDSVLNHIVFYIKTLAVPARRNTRNLNVLKGQELFQQINCSGCHKPVMNTGIDFTIPTLSNQRIQPYTDLLLHDMGEGLADNRSDFLANGREWKTPPLWGIGLLPIVNGTPFYLHDGRARSIEEAILWHGGEAEAAKNKFMELNQSDRKKLIQFIQSL